MASLNKVLLIGNLGKDPEMRAMPNGDAVATFSIATTDTWKDKQGQKQGKTEWHNITMFRGLAEIAGKYLKKGSSVYIEGRLQTRKWQDKTGADRYTTEIIADQMQMLGGKQAGAEPQQANEAPPVQRQAAPRNAPSGRSDQFEDDIPF